MLPGTEQAPSIGPSDRVRARRRAQLAGLLEFAAASAAFFAVTGFFAARKLLWFDELFTVYIARVSDPARFRAALSQAGDTLPPAIHVLTRASLSLFGEHHLAIRLPAMVGYWLMLAAIYAFVRGRCSRLAAWSAALLPLATNSYWYAFEARPYGLLLGSSAVALAAWQRAAGPRPGRAHVLLAAAMFVALMSHWYAIVPAAILAAAELVRGLESGRRGAGVLLALLAAAAVAAPLLYPSLAAGLDFRGLIEPPALAPFVFNGYDLLLGGLTPLLFLLLSAIALKWRRGGNPPGTAIPRCEAAAAFLFALSPIAAYAIAWVSGTQLLPRYSVYGVIGCAVLVGYAAECTLARPRARVAWATFLSAAVLANMAIEKLRLPDRARIARGTGSFGLLARMADLDPHDLVVVPDGLAFIQLSYYAPPETARRLVHVEDPASLGSRALAKLASYAPLDVRTLPDLMSASPSFALYDVGFESTVMASLGERGVTIAPIGSSDGGAYGQLYWVRLDPPHSAAARRADR